MHVHLKTVQSIQELRRSLETFEGEAENYPDRATLILRSTRYWIWDADTGGFGPGKFVGYRCMSFAAYEEANQHKSNGSRFDGNLTHRAIERVLGKPFAPDPTLHSKLTTWAESLLGPGILDGLDEHKWAFLQIDAPHSYWALVSNPEFYRLDRVIAERGEDYWTVKDSNVQIGDRVAFWQAKGRGSHRGVIALGEVLTNPEVMPVPPECRKYCKDDRVFGPERRVRVRFVQPPRLPLWLDEDNTGVLRDLTVSRAAGGTVFTIHPDQWRSLIHVVGGWQTMKRDGLDDALWVAEQVRGNKRGQGFAVNPVMRRAVEDWAMARAQSHFESLGYSVEPVGKPFDLKCRKDEEVLYVEVKGTTTEGLEILLTPNEVEFASTHREAMALFVVKNVQVHFNSGNTIASGGEEEIRNLWDIDRSRLTPLGYSYRLCD